MYRVSALVHTSNEESNIVNCIQSIIWVDELAIFDSGSKDKTLVHAQKFTRSIFLSKFFNDYSALRNEALKKMKYDWILSIDADETLLSNAENIVRKLISDKRFDGYWFPRRQYINNHTYLKHGYFYPDYQLRLFRNNGKIRYSGKIHEQPKIAKNRTKIIHAIEIHHNTSHSKYDSFIHFFRFLPYIRIEGKELSKKAVSSFELMYDIPLEFMRHMYRSFIKLDGYKDGYPGFRAAFNFALYQSSISAYAVWIRIRNKI